MIPPGKMAENDPMINPMRTEHCEMLYDYEPASPSLAHHVVELCFLRWVGKTGPATKLDQIRKPTHYETDPSKIHCNLQDPGSS